MDWSKARVLLVHSDIHVRRWAHEVLHKQKVGSVQSTRSAATGIDLLGRFRADVAVVQLAQSPVDGAEFARRIRDGIRSPNPDLPVVLIVDTPQPDLLRAACEAGIEGMIERPTTPEVFVAEIAQAIQEPQRFVATETYFGPCRRRDTPPDYPGPFRRKEDGNRSVAPPPDKPAGAGVPPTGPRPATRQPEPETPRRSGIWSMETRETDGGKALTNADDWNAELADSKTSRRPPGHTGPDIDAIIREHVLWLSTTGAKGTKAWLAKTDLAGCSLANANLTTAALREADLSDADCRDTTLASADLRRAVLSAADLSGANLAVANLRGADLKRARFQKTSLRGTDLAGATFADTPLEDADFTGANLLGTDFTGADLSQARGMTQGQIDKARLDGRTKLPPGLRRPGV